MCLCSVVRLYCHARRGEENGGLKCDAASARLFWISFLMGAIAMGAIVSKKGVRALAHFILRGNLPVCHSKLKKRSDQQGNRLRTLTSPCIGQSRNISRPRRSFQSSLRRWTARTQQAKSWILCLFTGISEMERLL